jgi:hypothetical protein
MGLNSGMRIRIRAISEFTRVLKPVFAGVSAVWSLICSGSSFIYLSPVSGE